MINDHNDNNDDGINNKLSPGASDGAAAGQPQASH